MGITVQNVEIVSGQEPDIYDEDFATTLYATFTVGGKALAGLLNKQERVLTRHLDRLNKDRKGSSLLRVLYSPRDRAGRVVKEILKALKKESHQVMQYWAADEGAALVRVSDVEFDVDSSWRPSVTVDPRGVKVKFAEVEVSMGGRVVPLSGTANLGGAGRWASERNLRKAVIKLAFDRPELRSDLLPLVKGASRIIDKRPPRIRLGDLTRTEKRLIKEAHPWTLRPGSGLYEIDWPRNYVDRIFEHLAIEDFIWSLQSGSWILTDKGVAAKAKLTGQSYEDLMAERWAYLGGFE